MSKRALLLGVLIPTAWLLAPGFPHASSNLATEGFTVRSGESATTDTRDDSNRVAVAIQHQGHTVDALPLVIDGGKTPEAIQTDLALKHLVRSLAVGYPASDDDVRRVRSHFARIGLSEADRAATAAALKGLRAELDDIQADRTIPASMEDLNEARTRENQLLDEHAERLRFSLSPDGHEQLMNYVDNHIKRRITIYGEVLVR